jgi:O-antigen ligase
MGDRTALTGTWTDSSWFQSAALAVLLLPTADIWRRHGSTRRIAIAIAVIVPPPHGPPAAGYSRRAAGVHPAGSSQ